MSVYFRTAAVTVAVFGLLVSTATAVPPESAQETRGPVRGPRGVVIAARSAAELRDWDRRVDRMLRGGELRVRQTREDPLVPGRTHQRADQYHRGVRVFGGDIARQLRGGATESVFGTVYEGIDARSRTRRSTRIARVRSSRSGPAHGSTRPWRRSWWCCRSMPAATR